jgi:FAD/FMN-containing dehydrogenase
MSGIATDVVGELRSSLAGRVITANDADYDQIRQVARGDVEGHPLAIARVAGADDIAVVIRLARSTGLLLSVFSGGHSSIGASTNDGGLVIDLRDMKAVSINAATRSAWAETGLSAAEMTRAAWEKGLAIGFGDTGSVGIGGITLGGGVGYLSRLHGLTIDNLLGAELVTADGELVMADANTNPDLFWAIRGGGGNFGVATRFHYQLRRLPAFTGGMMVLPATAQAIADFMRIASEAPEGLGTIANIMPCPPLPFVAPEIHGQLVNFALMGFAGSDEEAAAAMAPIRALGPLADVVKPEPYPDMYPPEDPSYRPRAIDHAFFMDHVDAAVAQTIIDRLNASDAALRAVQLRPLGRAIARVPADATAYAHRDAPIMAVAVNFWQDENDLPVRQEWLRQTVAQLDQGVPGAYVGFVRDAGVRLKDAYPDATYERLRDVKTKWDPHNVFRRNVNIEPRPTNS